MKRKRDATGTDKEKEAAEACSSALLEAYKAWVQRTREEELATLERGSKKWWAKTRELLNQKGKCSHVPALRTKDGEWVTEPEAKAQLLANTFSAKYALNEECSNEYTALLELAGAEDWEVPSVQDAESILKKLKEESATGPDGVPARVLRRCAGVLAKPFWALARKILAERRWPEAWLVHWILPLYKRKAVWDASNYRGVRLTAQLSKATERLLQQPFREHLTSVQCTGENQFAYKQERGARDALAFLTLTWVSGFCKKVKFVLYCSDVSGAFDRVRMERLLEKLKAKGVQERWVDLFASWLRARTAKVAVNGRFSAVFVLEHMVFQGTVWGPTLWNVYYEDAAKPVTESGFTEVVFADDLNAFKEVPAKTPNEEALQEAKDCQTKLHRWGSANQVSFDPTKESFQVLSPKEPEGEGFKLLGVPFDCQLKMEQAVKELTREAGWKLRTLLRTSHFHCDRELVDVYKSKLLSYVEYRTAALYHATDSVLKPLDAVQSRFLKALGCSEVEALMELNLAPLRARRDIAMLGVVHRTVLGKGPSHFRAFFKLAELKQHRYLTRRAGKNHDKQLEDPRKGTFPELVRRSALGLIAVYNLLPADLVEEKTVKGFQSKLQGHLKERAAAGCEDWAETLSLRVPLWKHLLR